MLQRIFSSLSSLKVTFVLLCAATVLVFAGTLAQVEIGLYQAQNQFFRSLVVFWGPKGADWRIPVLPGGYLIGTLLIVNLAAAHLRHFRGSRKQIGIALIHAGIVLLLLGQLATDLLQKETYMRLTESQAKNYSESGRANELAVIDSTKPDYDSVVAIPESRLAQDREIRHPELPFTLRVKEFLPNSEPQFVAPHQSNASPAQGVGQLLTFVRQPPATRMESRNVPAVRIEILNGSTSLGTWWLSNWLTEEKLVQIIWRQADAPLKKLLGTPQTFACANRTFKLALRPVRSYEPYSFQLLKFNFDKYKGTDIPKNFSSRVRVQRPDTGEDREVLIYMNNPLRYAGNTYYQSGYDPDDPRVPILQVVRNPGWLTPYLACVLVTLGLTVQFLMHLVDFARNRKAA